MHRTREPSFVANSVGRSPPRTPVEADPQRVLLELVDAAARLRGVPAAAAGLGVLRRAEVDRLRVERRIDRGLYRTLVDSCPCQAPRSRLHRHLLVLRGCVISRSTGSSTVSTA